MVCFIFSCNNHDFMFMQVLSNAESDYYLYIYQARFDLYKRANESEFGPWILF